MSESTRVEHLAWCKKRALEYVDAGDLLQAFTSMASDLGKHSETQNHAGIKIGMMMLLLRDHGRLGTAHGMREFIEGFN